MAGESFTTWFLGAFVSLITIINPPATLPIFSSVTNGLDADASKRVATSASFYSFCILVVSLFAGSLIMKAFGISYGAMRVAGGMVIGLLGHGMLYGKAEVSEVAKAQYGNPAFFPLALPGITGPGSIAVVIGLATQIRELHSFRVEVTAYLAVLLAMVAVCAVEFLLLRSARRVITRLGSTGIEVITRLSGFLLICVGVQFVASGVQTLYATLGAAAAVTGR
ncbi:MAG: MarC family NAAT transporter [Lautropia sp.]|nr:MarC family NAAT transporter [Lautropia sp.]